jgi:crotonobetainyl-CoA:carnitine CoA-transferase CaiB-like acyl-CoA transferase
MLSMSGFGRTGLWKDRVSYGQTLQAWAGFTQLTGFPDTDPSGPASAYSDAVGGMAGAQAVLLALIHRAKTGRGQWLDVSQFESLSSLLETLVLDMSANGPAAASTRAGNRLPHGGGAPHGAYRCLGEDRWVAISIFSDEEWRAFVEAIGSPQWAEDQRFATGDDRCRNADALDSFVDFWTIQHTAEDVMGLLQAAGVAAGVVQTGADLSRDPQLKERGFFRRVLDHQGEYRTIERAPYKLSRTPGNVTRGSPTFGADLTYVLGEVLGMSDDELADCAISGVFD